MTGQGVLSGFRAFAGGDVVFERFGGLCGFNAICC